MIYDYLNEIVKCPWCKQDVRDGDRIWLDGDCLCPQCYEYKRQNIMKRGTKKMNNENLELLKERIIKFNQNKQLGLLDKMDKQIVRENEAIETLLTAYEREKNKRIELQQKLEYLKNLRDCDEEFEL